MKNVYFAMLAIAATLCVSCMQQEQPFDDVQFGENDLVFTFRSVETKSADTNPTAVKGVSIPVSNDGMGTGISLEETIEDLNPSPATKGTPAYTFNVGTLYTTMGVYASQGSFGDGTVSFGVLDEYKHLKEGKDGPKDGNVENGWRYTHSYSSNPWPGDNVVDFYFNMPLAPTGLSFTSRADKEIKFSYTSPSTGEAQQDILFSQASYSKNQHDDYLPNGAPVLMYHALTGVKFRNGHSNDGSTKTIIKSVKFNGLASTGDCTIDLTAENKVTWEGLDDYNSFTITSFSNPTYVPSAGANNSDGTVSYGTGEGKVTTFNGTSWTAAAADHNLNDENGSLTFWFIPQQIDESVTLEITFLVKTPDTPNGTEVPHIIKFGELVTKTTGEGESAEKTYTEWKAGQLRTYTLKPFDVDVEIFDTMSNLKKENLHVTNTGNVDEYVRIMIIGNWYGWKSAQDRTDNPNNPSILVGYTSPDPNDDTMVTPWYREDDLYNTGFDSTFPGGRPLASSHWKRGTGSYFYYDTKIGAGQQLSGTAALFQYYQLSESMIPTIYLPVANQTARQEAVGVHLVMEVVVQAIPTTVNGTEVDCWTAWSNAVGKEIKAK